MRLPIHAAFLAFMITCLAASPIAHAGLPETHHISVDMYLDFPTGYHYITSTRGGMNLTGYRVRDDRPGWYRFDTSLEGDFWIVDFFREGPDRYRIEAPNLRLEFTAGKKTAQGTPYLLHGTYWDGPIQRTLHVKLEPEGRNHRAVKGGAEILFKPHTYRGRTSVVGWGTYETGRFDTLRVGLVSMCYAMTLMDPPAAPE